MPKVAFIQPDSSCVQIDVPVGGSLMRAAVAHGVHGIMGDCGGDVSCATCHVFIDASFLSKIPPPERNEDEMLDFTATARECNSRLSCQILMTEELSGLTVRVAESQV
jgi:2Fe-2S ferredoxin